MRQLKAWFGTVNLINGLTLGLEHITGDEDDEGLIWMVVFHCFLLRFTLGQVMVDAEEA